MPQIWKRDTAGTCHFCRHTGVPRLYGLTYKGRSEEGISVVRPYGLIPPSGESRNVLNRVSSLTILGCRRPPPPLNFFLFFYKFIGKMLYFSAKKGIIHSHRDLNSVSSSTDKTNLLDPMPSRLRSPSPRVRKPPRAAASQVWRNHFLELETSGTQLAGVDQHSHRWP